MYGDGEVMHGKVSNTLKSLYKFGFVTFIEVPTIHGIARYWRLV